MGAEVIKRVLALSPRGQTSDQLIWRLRQGGARLGGDQILAGLQALHRSGDVLLGTDGRWRLRRIASAPDGAPGARRREAPPTGATTLLHAVSLRTRPGEPAASAGLDPDGAVGAEAPQADWGALLSYYESTLRLDPRGSIAQYPDRHESQFLLFRAPGTWWREVDLVAGEETLPSAFRESLARRDGSVVALGYPLCVVDDGGVPTLVPALLVPARWCVTGAEWHVSVGDDTPTLNPKWLQLASRASRMPPQELERRVFGDAEAPDLSTLSEKLGRLLARQLVSPLRPGDPAASCDTARIGIHNVAALFLPDDSSFTRAAADDLAHIRTWSSEDRFGTALARALEGAGPSAVTATAQPPALLNVAPLSPSQIEAASLGLEAPLSVVQGPPGTGKSQVIVSLIATLAMSGKTVLFVSRNHQPLDEVGARLAALAPDIPFVIRTRDSAGEIDVGFVDAMRRLAEDGAPAPAAGGLVLEARLASAQARARERWRAFVDDRERQRIHLRLSEHVERLRRIREHLDGGVEQSVDHRRAGRARGMLHILRRLFVALRGWAARPGDDLASLPPEADVAALERAIADDRGRLAALGPASDLAKMDDATLVIEAKALLPAVLRQRLAAAPDDHTRFAERLAALTFAGRADTAGLSLDDARAVLARRPVWITPSLSAPKRIPLHPGLFDVVIFDEASQCDIASSLPLLARARRAVVVGDPMQLSFIPSLNLRQENALMDAAGLPRVGRERLAQSVNSLFRFADMRPGRKHAFLSDQFRSAGPIVDYLNAAFYRGRLTTRRAPDDFRLPSDYRPGLDWQDVQGVPEAAPEGGALNEAEARAAIAFVRKLAENADFTGSVGILSPFNGQVGLLRRLAETELPAPIRVRVSLKIATIDRFQGGEADVVLFSLVAGPRLSQNTLQFLARERRRINVAVSRARALCVVFGDRDFARRCGIPHIAYLAERAGRSTSVPDAPFESLWERRMAAALERRGLAYHAQYPVGWRRLDFALFRGSVKLDLEVDGRAYHTDVDGARKIQDTQRDREMIARGWKVRRFWVHELDTDMETCLDIVERDLAAG